MQHSQTASRIRIPSVLTIDWLLAGGFILLFVALTRWIDIGERAVVVITDLSWLFASLVAGIRCWLRASKRQGRKRLAWQMFAYSCLAWAAGMIYWAYQELVQQQLTPFPAWSDVGYLLMAPLGLFGFYFLKDEQTEDKYRLLDFSQLGIIACSILMIHQMIFIDRIAHSSESFAYIATAIAYPVMYMSVAIYAVLAYSSVSRKISFLTYNLLLVSFLIQALTDTVYAYSLLGGEYAVGNYLDVYWIISFSVIYLAAATGDRAEQAARTSLSGEQRYSFEHYVAVISLVALGTFTYYYLDEINFVYLDYILPVFSLLIFFIALHQLLTFYQSRKLFQQVISSQKLFNIELEKQVHDRTRLLEKEIHTHQQTEQQLKEAQRLGKIGHWHWDLSSGDLEWSEQTYLLFGLKPAAKDFKPLFENFRKIIFTQDLASVEAAINASLQNDEKFSIDYRIVLPDGNLRWIHAEGDVKYRDAEKRHPISMLGTIQDIDDRKNYEAELRLASMAAQEASQAKSDFLSRMSHEFRTPLNAIIGFSQLIELDQDLNKAHRDSINEVISAGEHLLALVNELLDISKIEAGDINVAITRVQLNDVLRDALSLTKEMRQAKQITLDYVQSDCAQRILADELRLRQVFVNLITNAIKYNKPAGRIAINCRVRDDFCEIDISDTGIGIPEELMSDIFNRFARVADDTRGIDGIGIGLFITKEYVEAMSGTIQVSSTYGSGSTFTVRLPLVISADTDE